MKLRILKSALIDDQSLCSTITSPLCVLSHNIYIYLELACHAEQDGDQRFILRPRIAKLW